MHQVMKVDVGGGGLGLEKRLLILRPGYSQPQDPDKSLVVTRCGTDNAPRPRHNPGHSGSTRQSAQGEVKCGCSNLRFL